MCTRIAELTEREIELALDVEGPALEAEGVIPPNARFGLISATPYDAKQGGTMLTFGYPRTTQVFDPVPLPVDGRAARRPHAPLRGILMRVRAGGDKFGYCSAEKRTMLAGIETKTSASRHQKQTFLIVGHRAKPLSAATFASAAARSG